MFYINKKGIPLAQFQSFSQRPEIFHFISTRQGGVSQGAFESLNLSTRISDRDNANENRKLLAGALGIAVNRLVFPGQCHSDIVKTVDSQTRYDELCYTDGLVTATLGLFIGVLVADCVPVLLYDRKQHVAGIAHAGWRGTVSSIASKTVRKIKDEFNSKPSDIVAGLGPSISADNYEVGEEVIDKVFGTFGNNAGLIKPSSSPDKGYFDLWKANKLLLLESGLPSENIETAGICTFNNSDIFFSARKLGPDSGRFGAGIMLI
jgi:polyphenol oxidase